MLKTPTVSPTLPIQSAAFALPTGRASIVRLPGVPEPGPGHAALFAAARHAEGRAFVMGPGFTATALWAAQAGAEITGWTDHAAEARALALTFAQNRQAPPRCLLQAGFEGLEPKSYDLALLHLPRGRALQAEALRLAAALLVPGGRLAFVGAKNEGVKGAVKAAQGIFGHAGIVTRKGGWHAGLAQRPPGAFPLPTVSFEERDIVVDGAPTRLMSCAGAFAHDRLDDGAAALIAGMEIAEGARVLDMGCGTGLVGLAALRRGAEVVLTDVSARACASARRTLAANGYPEPAVWVASGATVLEAGAEGSLADATLDTVVTNPPFHQGHGVNFEVAQHFVREAARVLRAGGAAYLVANAFLPYEPWLRASFRRVAVAWEDRRFKVWRAFK